MSADTAQRLIEGALAAAEEMGLAISIAVYDSSALMLAFHRMDGAMLGTVEVACKKAKTAVFFPLSTRDFGALCRDENLDGMLATNDGLIGFAGGLPLPGGGGIGISGGSADQDERIAERAIAFATDR